MNEVDIGLLRTRLQNWRKEQMIKEGLGDDQFFGVQLILSDEILDHIVDLAHQSKLLDVKTLAEQTDWRYANIYGPKILELCALSSRAPLLRRVLPASGGLQPISPNVPDASFASGQVLIQDVTNEYFVLSSTCRATHFLQSPRCGWRGFRG
ncbi:hypothetical protein BDN72DRAFT_674866 [Pluteus cervinus]|uniref:Uncharacterized protein n=1 Tax=Pluteus cervinus TaxID=181527 RepID=A0ACD3ARH0_9AGAR|nr:hypothetical protein BDN72DRAFT_674866 [Pluteus cervinus]